MAENDDIEQAPMVDVTKTPEFEMAIAAERAKMFDEVRAQVRTELAAAKPSSDDSDSMRLARMFASSMAEVADAGTGRKRVAPEILEARRVSEKRLYALLDETATLTAEDKTLPIYTVISATYIGDRLVEPFYADPTRKGAMIPQQIIFCSKPNFALKPVNQRAIAIYEAWLGTMAGGNGMTETPWGPSAGMSWDPLNAKPVWMTDKGRLLSVATATAIEHGMADAPELPIFGVGGGPGATEMISPHDPRATKVAMLGTLAEPAMPLFRNVDPPRR